MKALLTNKKVIAAVVTGLVIGVTAVVVYKKSRLPELTEDGCE
jgi:hypothetical protein